MAIGDLRHFAELGPTGSVFLKRLMTVLDIDPDAVARLEPSLFNELQRACAVCNSRQQCARDLASRCNNQEWQDYCANVATLNLLSALPWFARQR